MRSIKALILGLILSALTSQSLFAGKAERYWYTGLTGTQVSILTGYVDPFLGNFPTNFDASLYFPDSVTGFNPDGLKWVTDSLEQFTLTVSGTTLPPGDALNNYGNFVRGYLEAPQTGNFTFWIASDDDSQLFLSSNHLPANKTRIAFNNGAVGFRNYGAKSTQRSALIPMVKGNKYYFEVLLKEGGGGDHVSVGWQLPDGTLNRPISGIYLAPFNQSFTGSVISGTESSVRQLVTATIPSFANIAGIQLAQPQSTNVLEGTDAVLYANLTGTQPITYQWYKGTLPTPANLIAGENLSSLSFKSVTIAGSQGQYLVTATNSFGGVKSAVVTLTVNPDAIKPTLVSANAFGRLNGVTIVFSEPVDSVTALATNNYYITNKVGLTVFKVLAAQFPFGGDFKTVDLVTEPFTVVPDNYTVVVSGVKDRAATPNTILTNSSVDFASVFGDGLITARRFDGIGNTDVASMTNNANFINNNPSSSQNLNIFESGINVADNYGIQFVGFLIPKTNGNYTFAVASDDNSHLFLSTDESAANKKVIAAEPGWSNTRQWINSSGGNNQRTTPGNGQYNNYSNSWGNPFDPNNPNTLSTGPGTQINISKPQALIANKRYYIEYLGKEGGGGDDFAVTWVVPSGPPPATGTPLADGQIPIQGAFLSTTGAVGGAAISITLQPSNFTTNDAKAARFTVQTAGAGPVTYQWFRGNYAVSAAVADSTAATLVTQPVTPADDQSTYFVIARNGFSSITSSIVTLTVVPDVTAPTLVGAKGSAFFNKVTVAFSESLNESTATNLANYSFSPSLNIVGALLGPQRTNVILTTAFQPQATLYTLTVNNVRDGSGNSNLIAAASTTQFTSFVPVRGFVLQQFYGNIGGTAVTNLQSAGSYPDAPDTTTYRTSLSSPSGIADNYGIRLSGTLTVPFNDLWSILVSSDDASSFYISSDTNPANITNVNSGLAVAREPGCCNGYATTIGNSLQFFMGAGENRYFEALVKEGGGGDFLNVAWLGTQTDPGLTGSGATAYINGRPTIPIDFLTAYADPSGATVAVRVPPVASVSVTELTPLTGVFVMATGAITGSLNPPISYIWQRKRTTDADFKDLAADPIYFGQRSFSTTNLVLSPITSADNGALLRCVISVPGASIISGTTLINVVADNNPPRIISAVSDGSLSSVLVTFSKPVKFPSPAGNFTPTFSNGVGNNIFYITAFDQFSQGIQPNQIRITTSAMSPYTVYTLVFDATGEVVDTTGGANLLAATNFSFTSWVVAAGLIERRQFNNIGGGNVSDMTNNAAFIGNQPSVTYLTNTFEGGDGIADNYGSDFRGFILPLESGPFKFFISSDDQSLLYLSTDANPANVRLIAVEPSWNNGRAWISGNNQGSRNTTAFVAFPDVGPAPSVNQSVNIELVAGQAYYVEYMQKEGGGGDNGAVAWRTPSQGADPANGSLPIPGAFLGSYINPDLSKVTVITSPTDITTVERRKVTFTQTATASSALSANSTSLIVYQWQKETTNGSGIYTNIPGANTKDLVYDAYLSDNGLRFRSFLQLTNPVPIVVSNFTGVATLTVTADTIQPTLVSVTGSPLLNQVILTFSERVSKAAAGTAFSAAFNNGLAATTSAVDPVNDKQIIVTTTPQTPNTLYSVVVNGVTDLAATTPNRIPEPSLGSFTSWVDINASTPSVGAGIVFKQYNSIGGGNVSDLTNNAAFRNGTPNLVFATNEFNHPGTSPNLDSYGTQWQGYLIAPETGLYKFFVASDDQSQLFLSSDENPANRVLIAAEPTWNNNKSWISGNNQGSRNSGTFNGLGLVNPVNQSKLINLVAGRAYYVEYLAKEGGGGDNSGVAWKLPSDASNPPNGSPAIGGAALTGLFVNPDASKITITSQPGDQTTPERRLITFKVVATAANALTPNATAFIQYQWQRSDGLGGFTNVPSTSASYTLDALTTDDGAQFRAILTMTNLFPISVTNISSVATLTVVGDTTAPTLLGLTRNAYQTNLVLTFSERIASAGALNLANYSLTNANGSIAITGLAQDPNGSNIVVYTALQPDGTNLTLTVSNIVDLATVPNTNLVATSTYNTFANGRGYLRYERWNNIGGTDVAALLSDARYGANTPDAVDYVPSGWARQTANGVLGASGNIENFGARMIGYFNAPSNGVYRFFSRGDDGTRVMLSTDLNPANRIQVAGRNPNCCADYNVSTNNGGGVADPGYPTATLVAGQRYYIEAIYKEGGGGDWMEIQVAPASANAPSGGGNSGNNVMGAALISTLVDPDLATLSISAQPVDITRTNGNAATFSVTATGSSPLPGATVKYQWQKNGIDIVGATGSSYTIASATAADNGSYRALVYVPGKESYTTAAALGVVTGPGIVTPVAPTSVNVAVGGTQVFTVTANGDAPLGYQWQLNGVNVGSASAVSSLTLNNVQYANQGTYTVIITNGVGAITNGSGVLNVLVTSYGFTNATKVGSTYGVSFNTDLGRTYNIKYKDSLTNATWLPLTGTPTVIGTGGAVSISDPTATGPERYYRIDTLFP